jgi:hypothetical protein
MRLPQQVSSSTHNLGKQGLEHVLDLVLNDMQQPTLQQTCLLPKYHNELKL